MESFNPTRLDLARRRRGKTKTELAKDAGVSTRALTSYERGEREPYPETLARLAAALRFPTAFFFGRDIDEPHDVGVSFRSMSTMTARQRHQAIAAAAIAVELDDWIRDRFNLPEPRVPRLPDATPEEAAEAVREHWGMGAKRAPNMVHLLEAHGVRVFSLVQECAEVDAFSFWRRGIPYVFLNSMKTAERSRMDAAHELGHLVLHAHGGPAGRVAEDQAQGFGAAFLMPRRSILADAPRQPTAAQIIKAKKLWNVAAMNLTRRMRHLGLLSEWQARSLYIQLGQLGYRDGEPEGVERETSQILPKVFEALRGEGMTRRSVADQLNIGVDELNRSVFGLAVANDLDARNCPAIEPPRDGPPELRVVV